MPGYRPRCKPGVSPEALAGPRRGAKERAGGGPFGPPPALRLLADAASALSTSSRSSARHLTLKGLVDLDAAQSSVAEMEAVMRYEPFLLGL